MNKKGHTKALVAAQPENKNAAKAGVFSDRLLAPRVHELEQAIEERGVPRVVVETLRREVASLLALCEAMDESLAKTGVTGRRGEPLTMITLRARAQASGCNARSRDTRTLCERAARRGRTRNTLHL